MHPQSSELFKGADRCSHVFDMPVSVENFADGLGDLHTSLNVVRKWLLDEGKVTLPKWCLQNGIQLKGMRHITQYMLPFRELWDYTGKVNVKTGKSSTPATSTVCTVLKSDLCYYMGHPSLGYKKIRNGSIVRICPASAIHCLRQYPRYVCVFHPRHIHVTGCSTSQCSSFVNITDEQINDILQTNFPRHTEVDIERDQVSIVPEVNNVGTQVLEQLCRLWNNDKDGKVHREMQELVGNAHVIFEADESKEHKSVRIYANKDFHCSVREFMNIQIRKIQSQMRKASGELSYPRGCQFRVLLGPGAKCDQVLFPFIQAPEDDNLQRLDAMRKQGVEFVRFTTEVRASLELGDLPVLKNRLLDRRLQTTVFIKSLFRDLKEDQWHIEDMHVCRSHPIVVGVLFRDYGTARRGLQIVKDSRDLRVPVTLLNSRSAYRDLNGFSIAINKQVMRVKGDALMIKLDNYRRNRDIKLEYKRIWLDDGDASIQLIAKNPRAAIHLLDCLRQFLTPLVRHVQLKRTREYLNARNAQYHLDIFNKQTSSFVHYDHCLGNIYAFGKVDHDAFKELFGFSLVKNRVFRAVRNYHGDSAWTAFIDVKLKSDKHKLPNDFFIKFRHRMRNLEVRVQKDVNTLAANVDLVRSAIWVEHLSKDKLEFGSIVKSCVSPCLVLDYGIRGVQFELVTYEPRTPSCSTCYGEMGDYYTMEGCGHIVCHECLKCCLSNAITETKLPITCPDCDQRATMADIENWTTRMHLYKLSDVIGASMRDFLSWNAKEYRACAKINCNGLARRHDISNELMCGVCSTKICPSCLKAYHKGMTCAEYEELLNGIDGWMKKDKNRKSCTNCCSGIEKVDRCNNVYCINCHKSLCWVCMKVFNTSGECYGHLDAEEHWQDV